MDTIELSRLSLVEETTAHFGPLLYILYFGMKRRKSLRGSAGKVDSRDWMNDLVSIPKVKKGISHLLAIFIRERWIKARKGIILLNILWRARGRSKRGSEAHVIEEDEEVFKGIGGSTSEYLVPSPMVYFKGKPLLFGDHQSGKAQERRHLNPLYTPILQTPIRSRRICNLAMENGRKKENKMEEQKINLIEEIPTSQISQNNQSKERKNTLNFSSQSSFGSTAALPLPTLQLNSKNKPPQRVRRQGNNTLQPTAAPSTDKRNFRDVLYEEVGKRKVITDKNTITNSGYRTCEFIYSDVVIPSSRPASPPGKFMKTQASSLRKWSDTAKGRMISQQEWEKILKDASPKRGKSKCVKWSSDLKFIDSDEGEGEVESSTFKGNNKKKTAPGVLRKSKINTSPEIPKTLEKKKNVVTVQRIQYIPSAKREKKKKQ